MSACKQLKTLDKPVYCAKINGDQNKDITEKQYQVHSYPTLKYFKGNKVIDYDGAYNEHPLISWIKTGKAETTATIDKDDIDRLTDKEEVFWVYFGERETTK